LLDGKTVKRKFNYYAKKLVALDAKINFDIFPTNYNEEVRKFFSDDYYNPSYEYKQFGYQVLDIASLNTEIATDSFLPRELTEYLQRKLEKLHQRHVFSMKIGRSDFYNASLAYYDWNLDLKIPLHKYLYKEPREEEKDVTASVMEEIFRKVIYNNHIEGWSVRTDVENDFTIRVNHSSKELIIGARVKKSIAEVERLIVHEIGTHIWRGYQSTKQPNLILQHLRYPDVMLIEEGIAVYNENNSSLGRVPMKSYALRYMAVEHIEYSFRDIYNLLLNYTGEEESFQTAFRVKRGMANTAQPGGYLKDAAYLLGLHRISQAMNSSNNLWQKVMSAKISLNDIFLENYDLLSVFPYTFEYDLGEYLEI
jgi:hypothetical protein